MRARVRTYDRASWFFRITATFLLIAAALLVVDFGLRWTSDMFGVNDRSSEPTPVPVDVAGTRLTIPGNMIRYANDRTGEPVNRVDLVVHWPTLGGFTNETARDFADASDTPPFFYLTIQKRESATDSAGRLSSVYQHFFTDRRVPAPAGLVGRELSEDSGLAGEEVYFEAGSTRPFTVHCMHDDGTGFPVTCMTEIHAGGDLSVQLRFRKGLLPQWQELSRGMSALLVSFGVFLN
ncbi:hypothetical protein A6302_01968 [Methylobrevis pamukkalensis]|uniref:Transmembrane protein n=1 Tax=Methylobrevis pamukkalensis TaxID=1439726 RepID=A0A1E3H2Y0_9HYPH|nr:hypothetical protein A6302_01968 [Methylobrevis pamukkalensis]